jgi:hypothetical protein
MMLADMNAGMYDGFKYKHQTCLYDIRQLTLSPEIRECV